MKKMITFFLAGMLFAPACFAQFGAIRIFPNPVREGEPIVAVLDTVPPNSSIVLIRADGKRLVVAERIAGNRTSLSLPAVYSSVYLLAFISPGMNPVTKKVVVSRR